MTTTTHPRWLRQWIAACKVNLTDPFIHELAIAVPLDFVPDVSRAVGNSHCVLAKAMGAAAEVRRVLPYRFKRGANQSIYALQDARRRGWGACGDGSAALAAVALLAPQQKVTAVGLCYEEEPADLGYAHVRIDVDGIGVDSYPDASWDVAKCAAHLDVRELVGWRAHVDRDTPPQG